jgi:AhpD family alkylhydroperoxidase
LGLVASLVLRCDDCVRYHILQCHQAGVTTAELEEALSIALIVGGSITIPHLRRAFQAWVICRKALWREQERGFQNKNREDNEA